MNDFLININRYILITCFSTLFFNFSNADILEPKLDLILINTSVDKSYNNLGVLTKNKKELNYSDSNIGGNIGFEGNYDNYGLNTLLYFSQRLKNKSSINDENETTWYDEKLDNLHYLGEFYIKYKDENHLFSIGRQTIKSQLVDENHRITNNSFEGIKYNYYSEIFDFESFYFNKISSSSLANSVPFNHKYGFLGYGLGYKVGEFIEISEHILNEKLSTNGALHTSINYKNKNNVINLENLYVDNFFNTSILSNTYKYDNLTFKVGFTYQTSVGKDYIEQKYNKKLESKQFQGEISYNKNNFRLGYKVSKTPANKNAIYNGTLFTPFSNKAGWIKGFNTAHSFIADTLSQQFTVSKLFKFQNFYPISLATSYIKYDIGDENGDVNYSIKTREKLMQGVVYFSKNNNFKIQYSDVDNVDLITNNTKNLRLLYEYKY